MKPNLTLGFALVLVAGALTGCGATHPVAVGNDAWYEDQADVSAAMSQEPETIDEDVFASEDVMDNAALRGAAVESLDGPDAALERVRFWRRIVRSERRFEFAFSDSDSTGRPTRALVVIHRNMIGSFNVLRGAPPEDSVERVVIRKPLADAAVRRVLLQRLPVTAAEREVQAGRRSMWKVVASSGVKISSINREDNPDTRILSVRFQSGGRDTTITDPLGLIWRQRVLAFEPEAEVQITVTTERPDDVVYLMHRERRMFLRPNGDNTYGGVWRAPMFLGVKHFGVDALAHGTVFGDAPYSSQAWLWHYVVVGGDPIVMR